MENNSIQFENLLKRVEDYGNTTIELYKYKAINKSSALMSSVITYRIIIVGFTLFSIFLSCGLALWLGDILGKLYYGVFIITGVYGAMAFILYLSRDKIKQHICDSMISQFFN